MYIIFWTILLIPLLTTREPPTACMYCGDPYSDISCRVLGSSGGVRGGSRGILAYRAYVGLMKADIGAS